ncbi:unnamed protein product [Phytophthora fragariaefolia]|uniref:Unnamed protein product n=1 Tax=Phytophthora fragariaefolia TaxID=1490495 RepID=A0A9W6Y919_9STRA|nr:unnamed protein product [Phytophthora fragariaefolia]
MALQAPAAPSGSSPEATEPPQSKPSDASASGDAKTKAKPKAKPRAKPKPPSNTLDRWFKPAPAAAKEKKPSEENPKQAEDAAVDTEVEKPLAKKKAKSVGAARNFVQRYIHITDQCRVCEQAKTDGAARCELRCATCSMTVHKKCYAVKGDLPDGDWNCRRCQFIYDETEWEDISSLVGVAAPEGVAFPKCQPLDATQKLHQLQTDCDFAAVFLFLQRFRRLGLKLSNVVTTLEVRR